MTVGLVQPTARRIGRSGRCSSACGGKLTGRDYVNAAAISKSAISRAQVVPLIQERLRDSRNRRLTPVHIWYTAGNGSGPRQVCKVRSRHP
jgi:hypothetical protein